MEAGDRMTCVECGRGILLCWWRNDDDAIANGAIPVYDRRTRTALVMQPHLGRNGVCFGTVEPRGTRNPDPIRPTPWWRSIRFRTQARPLILPVRQPFEFDIQLESLSEGTMDANGLTAEDLRIAHDGVMRRWVR